MTTGPKAEGKGANVGFEYGLRRDHRHIDMCDTM